MTSTPRVFTIPASARFLPMLIDALMNDRLGLGFKPGRDPLALAGVTIYLPTRRACRLVRESFLDIVKRRGRDPAALVSLNDVDADEIMFAEAAAGDMNAAALELAGGAARPRTPGAARPADPEMGRRASSRVDKDQAPLVASSPQAAMMLAQDLARLMDDMTTRQVDWDAPRRARAGRAGSLLAAHARLPQGHSRAVAGSSRRDKAASSRPSAATG